MSSSTATRSFRVLRNQEYAVVDGKQRYRGLVFSPTQYNNLATYWQDESKYWGFAVHPTARPNFHDAIASFFLKKNRLTASELADTIRFIAKNSGIVPSTHVSEHQMEFDHWFGNIIVYKIGMCSYIRQDGPQSFEPIRLCSDDLLPLLRFASHLTKGVMPLGMKFPCFTDEESCGHGRLLFSVRGRVMRNDETEGVITINGLGLTVTPHVPENQPFDGWGPIHIHRNHFGKTQPQVGEEVYLHRIHLRMVEIGDPNPDWQHADKLVNTRLIRVAQELQSDYD